MMSYHNPGARPRSEQCPKRGPSLAHTPAVGSLMCEGCGVMVYLDAPTPSAPPAPSEAFAAYLRGGDGEVLATDPFAAYLLGTTTVPERRAVTGTGPQGDPQGRGRGIVGGRHKIELDFLHHLWIRGHLD